MTTIINGSSPSITFSDSTTQASAGLTAASPTITSGVLTFPDTSTQSTGTSGNFAFNSGYGSAVTAYGCRAWVNFDGTSSSPSTRRGSGNVSSVTKNGTGSWTVNFSTAMTDLNYSVVSTGGRNPNGSGGERQSCLMYVDSYSASAVTILGTTTGGSSYDHPSVFVSVFR